MNPHSLGATKGNPATKGNLRADALDVLAFLNEKANKRYQPVEANLKPIMARMREGATAGQCRQVIVMKAREWLPDPKMAQYLRPGTLFNAEKFWQYVGALVVPEA